MTTVVDEVRLPVSNALLKRDLDWRPALANFRLVLATLTEPGAESLRFGSSDLRASGC
jgi:hypothetical protein